MDNFIAINQIDTAMTYARLGEAHASQAIAKYEAGRPEHPRISVPEVLGAMYAYLHGFRWMIETREDESLARTSVRYFESTLRGKTRFSKSDRYRAMALVYSAIEAGEFAIAQRYVHAVTKASVRHLDLQMQTHVWSLWSAIVDCVSWPEEMELRAEVVKYISDLLGLWQREDPLLAKLDMGLDDLIRISYAAGKYLPELKVEPFTRVNVVQRLRWPPNK